MRRAIGIGAGLLVCLAVLAGCSKAHRPKNPMLPGSTIAIVGGAIVNPALAEAPVAGDVVISEGRIIAVGEGLDLPPGIRTIDARGRYVVPGLSDMHAHLAASAPPGRSPERYVGFGVLGVRDMGGDPATLFALRRDIASGRRIGPYLYTAGPTLNGEKAADFHRVVKTAAEARAAVRELRTAGVDFIKIHRQTPLEAFVAIADETKRLSLSFSGHVPLATDWIAASAAGMASIEHIQTLLENEVRKGSNRRAAVDEALARIEGARGDEIFAALARNGTYFDPTLVGYEVSWDKDPEELRGAKQRLYARMRPLVGRAARAGIPILAGTDVMDRHGDMLLIELERLVDAGLSPLEALRAATAVPRAMTGKGPGRIAAGEPALLLLIDANPIADIRNLRRLSTVVLGGRVLGSGELAALRSAGAAKDRRGKIAANGEARRHRAAARSRGARTG